VKILLIENGETPPAGTPCHVHGCFERAKEGVTILETGTGDLPAPTVGASLLCGRHIFQLRNGAEVELDERPGRYRGLTETWITPAAPPAAGESEPSA
jgi:hypothetical protein